MGERTKKVPLIDLGDCRDCAACLEICPEVFVKNDNTGLIEVMDFPDYPEDRVEEAIALCPEDCISWEEG
jgi:ferredoxin